MTTLPASGIAPRFKRKGDNLIDLTRDTFRDKSTALWQRFESERRANQYNLESGIPLEDFFRQEFGAMLHEPYSVGNGKIVDHEQYSCGDCDFIIYNKQLAPLLRPPATPDSRRKFFAYETTYGIIEVKSTLTLGALDGGTLRSNPKGTLWDACEKIFAYKELRRQPSQGVRWGINHPIGIAFFYNCDIDVADQQNRDALLAEFAAINMSVPVEMRVNAAYVLNKLSLSWVLVGNASPSGPAFLSLQHPVESPHPMWASYSPTGEDTLYSMYTLLWSTLARTQLTAPDLVNQYGAEIYLRSKQHRGMPCSIEAKAESFAVTSGVQSEQALAYMRGDYDKIAAILSEAVKDKPTNVEALLRLASFLFHKKQEVGRAKELFKQAVAMTPDSVQAASDYAHALAATGHPPQEAEELLRKLVAKQADDPAAEVALASFLIKWKGDYSEALGILRELADKHPDDYPLLDAYATQLRNAEEFRADAERIYKRIIEAAPSQANTLGNLAQLLFWQGRTEEARAMLDRALTSIRGSTAESAALVVELSFYQYAHVPQARTAALRTLKYLLLRGAASPDWNLTPDVERATQSGHPQPNLLRRIADVIVGRLDLQVLRQDPEWSRIDE